MRRDIAIAAIVSLCNEQAGFRADAASMVAKMATPNRETLIEALLECGVIPESFSHDSTEEKLYAKYCDVLLAHALKALGLECSVVVERGDAADVLGKTAHYSIVGDAKAFRLSRTAKNQKDFKVTALSGWRGDCDYACLVSPLYQYPNTRSQIYDQATEKNVALLGYVHLAFFVHYSLNAKTDLPLVWNVGTTTKRAHDAKSYWEAVDKAVCKSVKKTLKELLVFKNREQKVLESLKSQEIAYLANEMERIASLTREEAIQRLIAKMNIPSRIDQISGIRY